MTKWTPSINKGASPSASAVAAASADAAAQSAFPQRQRISKLFADLRSKSAAPPTQAPPSPHKHTHFAINRDAEVRNLALRGIPALVKHASRSLSSEAFGALAQTVGAELTQLADGGAAASLLASATPALQQQQHANERRACVALIRRLSAVDFYDESAAMVALFWGLLRTIIVQAYADADALVEASRVLGDLARTGGSQVADLVAVDVRTAIDWLRVAPGSTTTTTTTSSSSSTTAAIRASSTWTSPKSPAPSWPT